MTATLRDGTELQVGYEVTTDIYRKCRGEVFVIEEINPYQGCESGAIVLVHLKSDPSRKLKGKKAPWEMPPGLDANWFKLYTPIAKADSSG